MSNTPSLLPCPFCGKTHSLIVGAASEMWDADEHGPYPHTESYAVFCDASTDGRRGGCGGAGGYRLTKDEAIEAWNRRTPQPVVREPLWIDPNDKTQQQYLPHIGEPVLFCHKGTTYYGKHTGASFVSGVGFAQKHFNTWHCHWMYPPAAHDIAQKGGSNAE